MQLGYQLSITNVSGKSGPSTRLLVRPNSPDDLHTIPARTAPGLMDLFYPLSHSSPQARYARCLFLKEHVTLVSIWARVHMLQTRAL